MSSPLKQNIIDLQTILNTINSLPEASNGVKLPELTNEGIASDLLSGKEFIDQEGNKVTGTMTNNGAIIYTMDGLNIKSIPVPSGYTSGGIVSLDDTIDNEVNAQANLITQIATVLENKASGEPTLQTKTVTPSASVQNVVPDSGYDGLNKVTVNAIPSNYIIPSGTLTITTNGTHNVKNYASAIVSVASSGGSGGENDETLNSLLNGTITSYSNNTMSKVRGGLFMDCPNLSDINLPTCKYIERAAFRNCVQLKNIDFPVCSRVGESAFFQCSRITSISLPECKIVDSGAFAQCSQLQSINLPKCTVIFPSAFASCKSVTAIDIPLCSSIYNYAFNTCEVLTNVNAPAAQNILNSAFSNCYALTTISLPAATTINVTVFHKCYNLKSLYLMGSSVCALKNSNAFSSTPIGGYSTSAGTYGSIYVPASMLASYKAATNWTYFSSRMVGI